MTAAVLLLVQFKGHSDLLLVQFKGQSVLLLVQFKGHSDLLLVQFLGEMRAEMNPGGKGCMLMVHSG